MSFYIPPPTTSTAPRKKKKPVKPVTNQNTNQTKAVPKTGGVYPDLSGLPDVTKIGKDIAAGASWPVDVAKRAVSSMGEREQNPTFLSGSAVPGQYDEARQNIVNAGKDIVAGANWPVDMAKPLAQPAFNAVEAYRGQGGNNRTFRLPDSNWSPPAALQARNSAVPESNEQGRSFFSKVGDRVKGMMEPGQEQGSGYPNMQVGGYKPAAQKYVPPTGQAPQSGQQPGRVMNKGVYPDTSGLPDMSNMGRFLPEMGQTGKDAIEAYKNNGLGAGVATGIRGAIGDGIDYAKDNPLVNSLKGQGAAIGNFANTIITGDTNPMFGNQAIESDADQTTPPLGAGPQQPVGSAIDNSEELPDQTPASQAQPGQAQPATTPPRQFAPGTVGANQAGSDAINREIGSDVSTRDQRLQGNGINRSVNDGVETLSMVQPDGGYGTVQRKLGQPQGVNQQQQPRVTSLQQAVSTNPQRTGTSRGAGYTVHGTAGDADRFFAGGAGNKQAPRIAGNVRVPSNWKKQRVNQEANPIRTFGDIVNENHRMALDKNDTSRDKNQISRDRLGVTQQANLRANQVAQDRNDIYGRSVGNQEATGATARDANRFALSRSQMVAGIEKQHIAAPEGSPQKAKFLKQLQVLNKQPGAYTSDDKWETREIKTRDPLTNEETSKFVQINSLGEMRDVTRQKANPTSTPAPLPANKGDLVLNQVYDTKNGDSTWNGTQFIPVK